MKTILTLLVCLTFSWHLTGVVWANDDARQKAGELLTLSKTQPHALSIETAKRALALYQSANDMPGIAYSYEQIGDRYLAQNLMPEATQYYELALQSFRQQSDVQKAASNLISLGYVEGRKAEWLSGISYVTQAQILTDDPVQLARAAAGMAYFFNESGLPENGLTQYQRAMEYYRQAGDTRLVHRRSSSGTANV